MRYVLFSSLFLLAFVLSFATVPLFKRVAISLGIVDRPGHRKIHAVPKPLLGGMAIALAFYLTVIGAVLSYFFLYHATPLHSILPGLGHLTPKMMSVLPHLSGLLVGGLLLLVVGLMDDRLGAEFPPRWKFLAQVMAALAFVGSGMHTSFMPGTTLDYVVTVIWIVGITNSFNLLDNMDGLSSGVASISALMFFSLTLLQGQLFMASIYIVLAGAILGFLPYNFNPSSIFMGDTGSLFIGYLMACLAVVSSYVTHDSASLLPVVTPILILSIPLFDTFSVIYIRVKEKRPIYVGDKRHFSHRLVDLGLTHKQAVLFIYAVGLCVGIAALLLPYVTMAGSVLLVVQAAVIYGLITVLMIVGMRRGRQE